MTRDRIEYFIDKQSISYPFAIKFMESKVEEIKSGLSKEFIWFLEHNEIYTAGTSARNEDLLDSKKFPIYQTNRGGQYTYHGPGQKIIYLMLDLKRRGYNIRRFINQLESWIIKSLKTINIESHTNQDKIGIWVAKKNGDKLSEEKIASIGLRVRKGITFHGISLNVNPNLENYKGIKPCGYSSEETTSIEDIGRKISQKELDEALINNFEKVFKAELLPTQTLS